MLIYKNIFKKFRFKELPIFYSKVSQYMAIIKINSWLLSTCTTRKSGTRPHVHVFYTCNMTMLLKVVIIIVIMIKVIGNKGTIYYMCVCVCVLELS